ncbi:Protein of unknown function [Gryllus bimaculatus]|nr:Protein of unknown function [Gryllus bimaculatus]
MESGAIPDAAITASSAYVSNVGPHYGRRYRQLSFNPPQCAARGTGGRRGRDRFARRRVSRVICFMAASPTHLARRFIHALERHIER